MRQGKPATSRRFLLATARDLFHDLWLEAHETVPRNTPSEEGRPGMVDRMLELKTAAPLLGISPWTLHMWTRERRFPFYRIGRRLVFAQSDVDRFLRANRIEPVQRQRCAFVGKDAAQTSESKDSCSRVTRLLGDLPAGESEPIGAAAS
jgi:excisionase family DNA binding protein